MLADKEVWLPIAREPQAPPVYRKEFSSDAAGLAKDNSIKDGPGVASICISESGEICFAFSYSWSEKMISFETDIKGKRFGTDWAFVTLHPGARAAKETACRHEGRQHSLHFWLGKRARG